MEQHTVFVTVTDEQGTVLGKVQYKRPLEDDRRPWRDDSPLHVAYDILKWIDTWFERKEN